MFSTMGGKKENNEAHVYGNYTLSIAGVTQKGTAA